MRVFYETLKLILPQCGNRKSFHFGLTLFGALPRLPDTKGICFPNRLLGSIFGLGYHSKKTAKAVFYLEQNVDVFCRGSMFSQPSEIFDFRLRRAVIIP
jgi:hypothetical protein